MPTAIRPDYVYDELNRLTSMTDRGAPGGLRIRCGGQPDPFTNGRNYETQSQYDPLRRLVKMIDALNGEVGLVYDAMGNVQTLTDQNGHSQTLHLRSGLPHARATPTPRATSRPSSTTKTAIARP